MANTAAGSEEPDEVIHGAHILRFEPPDLAFGTMVGDVSAADFVALIQALERFAEGKRWTLLLVDLRRMGMISAAARKVAVELHTSIRGTAIFGASFTMRVISILQDKAFHLLAPDRATPTVAFETEAEARAWLTERRKTLEAAACKG